MHLHAALVDNRGLHQSCIAERINPGTGIAHDHVVQHIDSNNLGRFTQLPCNSYNPIARKRDKLVENGILAEKGKSYEFTEDYPFKSPSGAAAIVLARTANGWLSWKNTAGKSLQDVKRES